MIKQNFKYNYGFKWHTNKNIFCKGYAFYNSSIYFSNSLIDLISGLSTFNEFTSVISQLNGIFSIVVIRDKYIWAATDIIRTFPIFFSLSEQITISDNVEFIQSEQKNTFLDIYKTEEFRTFGYTLGPTTLFKNIQQLQAGQVLNIEKNRSFIKDYFNYTVGKHQIQKVDSEQLITGFNECFDRIFCSIQNQQIAIPLSGGYDSRLIAVMAKNKGFKNVICYTYGNSNNPEVAISKKVAEKLGYKWVFVEYTSELFRDFENSTEFKNFLKYSSKFSSLFFLQEYFAVKHLKENSVVENNCVFIPGHSGDFLGGSQLLKNGKIRFKTSRSNMTRQLIKNKSLNDKIQRNTIKKIKYQVTKSLDKYYPNNKKKLAYSIFEDWDIKEKLSKLIANSSNVYDFFGFEYRLPYWDTELVKTFQHIPYYDKYGKKLFDKCLREIFAESGVRYPEEEKNIILLTRIHRAKQGIKKLIPNLIFNKYHKPLDRYNSTYYTKPFEDELDRNNLLDDKELKNRNAITSNWYIHKILHTNEH